MCAPDGAGGRLRPQGGDTGSVVYDFFIGRELNPRRAPAAACTRVPCVVSGVAGVSVSVRVSGVAGRRLGGWDLKQWCELTPGLSLWLLLDVAFAAAQWERSGSVSVSMGLVCVFHGAYVLDALLHEPAILTTMDITTDGRARAPADAAHAATAAQAQSGICRRGGAGSAGSGSCLRLVTWRGCRSPTARRPASCWCGPPAPPSNTAGAQPAATGAPAAQEHPVALSRAAAAAVLLVQAAGYAIFRGANGQKDAFRRNPDAPEARPPRRAEALSKRAGGGG